MGIAVVNVIFYETEITRLTNLIFFEFGGS